MLGTELIDLVVDLVVDPRLVIVDCVVLDSVPGQGLVQSIDHFDLFEVDDHATLSAARHIADSICLHCHLDSVVASDSRQLGMPSRFDYAIKQGTATEVNSDVSLWDLMDPIEHDSSN